MVHNCELAMCGIHKLKPHQLWLVVTGQHSAAICVQAVDNVGYYHTVQV